MFLCIQINLLESFRLFRLFWLCSGNGGRNAFRTRLISRAGGQDYGSFKQTPSNYIYRSLFSDHSAHGDPTIPMHHRCQPPCTGKGNREFLIPGGDQSRQPMTQRLQTSPRKVKKHPPTVPLAGAWQLRVGNSFYRSVLSEKPMSGSPAPNFGRAYLVEQISLCDRQGR